MSALLAKVNALIANGQWEVTVHAGKRLNSRGLPVADLLAGMADAKVVEENPNYHAGPCVLVLLESAGKLPLHALWGIPKGKAGPVYLMTAYVPDHEEWYDDNMTRRPK